MRRGALFFGPPCIYIYIDISVISLNNRQMLCKYYVQYNIKTLNIMHLNTLQKRSWSDYLTDLSRFKRVYKIFVEQCQPKQYVNGRLFEEVGPVHEKDSN